MTELSGRDYLTAVGFTALTMLVPAALLYVGFYETVMRGAIFGATVRGITDLFIMTLVGVGGGTGDRGFRQFSRRQLPFAVMSIIAQFGTLLYGIYMAVFNFDPFWAGAAGIMLSIFALSGITRLLADSDGNSGSGNSGWAVDVDDLE